MSSQDPTETLALLCVLAGLVLAGVAIHGFGDYDQPHDIATQSDRMSSMTEGELQRYIIDWSSAPNHDAAYTQEDVLDEMREENKNSHTRNLIGDIILGVFGAVTAYYGVKKSPYTDGGHR